MDNREAVGQIFSLLNWHNHLALALIRLNDFLVLSFFRMWCYHLLNTTFWKSYLKCHLHSFMLNSMTPWRDGYSVKRQILKSNICVGFNIDRVAKNIISCWKWFVVKAVFGTICCDQGWKVDHHIASRQCHGDLCLASPSWLSGLILKCGTSQIWSDRLTAHSQCSICWHILAKNSNQC